MVMSQRIRSLESQLLEAKRGLKDALGREVRADPQAL
jgi:hypothetical protein